MIDQWRIYYSLVTDYVNTAFELKQSKSVNENEIKKLGKRILILRILMLDIESTVKMEKYKWNKFVNMDVSTYLNTKLKKYFNYDLETAIKEISAFNEIPKGGFLYPKYSRLPKFSNEILNLCLKEQFISYQRIKKLNTRNPNGDEVNLSLCTFLRQYFYNCNISLSTDQLFQFDQPHISQFYLPSRNEIISTLDNELVNLPNHGDCFYSSKFLRHVNEKNIINLKNKYIPTKYSPPRELTKDEVVQMLFIEKLRKTETSVVPVRDIFPPIFSIPNSIEITFAPHPIEWYDDEKDEEVEENEGQMKIEIKMKKKNDDYFKRYNRFLKEIQLEERIKKQLQKQKKKELKKLKEKSQVKRKIKLELENKKKLDLMKKENEQIILQKKLEIENIKKLKLKNKKKMEKKNQLIIEAAEKIANKQKNKNNNNNNIKNNNCESEKKENNEIGNDISNNLIRHLADGSNIINNYNIQDYSLNTEQFFRNVNYQKEEGLDPNIQNEIDGKVKSLVHEEDEDENDNDTNNNNSNYWSIFK
ncbi:hypothetical protein ACTA71_009343 [Dictyostelium dimigraforme]